MFPDVHGHQGFVCAGQRRAGRPGVDDVDRAVGLFHQPSPAGTEVAHRALGEGLLEYVGPLVETHVHEKPLSIALREINEGLLTMENLEPTA